MGGLNAGYVHCGLLLKRSCGLANFFCVYVFFFVLQMSCKAKFTQLVVGCALGSTGLDMVWERG